MIIVLYQNLFVLKKIRNIFLVKDIMRFSLKINSSQSDYIRILINYFTVIRGVSQIWATKMISLWLESKELENQEKDLLEMLKIYLTTPIMIQINPYKLKITFQILITQDFHRHLLLMQIFIILL